jgi:signal peptidase I
MKRAIRDFLIMVAVAVVVFVGLRYTVQTFVVYGPSMQPNFWEHQRLLVNKVVYNIHDPERGDVIVFRPPNYQRDSYIKRIIGLPGEYVEMKDGQVFIHHPDGSVVTLDEPYVKEPANRSYVSGIIPPGEYFVLGDNRNNTNDSRNGWMVPIEDIIGKAWLSIWPPDKWGLAANYPPQEQIASAAND